ncbi:MAG: radical SAM/SPASM domain-containing protein [Candidatus Micrarchaeia archaeon]
MERVYPDFPFRVEFEVTSVCNLDCKYCYAKPFTWKTPSFENIEYLFKKTKEEADPFETVLVGGEPFIRTDMVSLIELANNVFRRGVQISTNGTLLSRLDKKQLIRLKDAVNDGVSLQVSIDSLNPSINDITRGKTKESIDGINTLEKSGIPFSVGIVFTNVNSNDIVATTSKLIKEYSYLVSLNLEPLQPTSILGAEYFELKQESTEMRRLFNLVNGIIKVHGRDELKLYGIVEDCSESVKFETPVLDKYAFKTCTAGLVRAAVFVDGSVTPCSLIRDIKIGNLYTDSWVGIWQRSRERFESIKDSGVSQCAINLLHESKRNDSSFVSLAEVVERIEKRKSRVLSK